MERARPSFSRLWHGERSATSGVQVGDICHWNLSGDVVGHGLQSADDRPRLGSHHYNRSTWQQHSFEIIAQRRSDEDGVDDLTQAINASLKADMKNGKLPSDEKWTISDN